MNPSIFVNSIVFRPDEMVEISYMEERDQSTHAGLIRTVVVERELLAEDFDDLVSDIQDIIDGVLQEIRHPSPTVPERRGQLGDVTWVEPPLPLYEVGAPDHGVVEELVTDGEGWQVSEVSTDAPA